MKLKWRQRKKYTYRFFTVLIVLGVVATFVFCQQNYNNTNGQNKGITVGLESSELSSSLLSVGISNAAFEQSYGLFNDISEPMWNTMKSRYQTASIYINPDDPLKGSQDEIRWLQENMWPNFNCPHLERIGKGEGRKFVCYPHRMVRDKQEKLKPDKPENDTDKAEELEYNCLVYSIGCAGNFHFEDAISNRYSKECEVHVFDPANWERKDDIVNRNIHYHAWGLKSTYYTAGQSRVWPKGRGGEFKTFPETLKLLGHEKRVIDLFKIDCEGCEWYTYKDWIGFGARQILMETHGVPLPNGRPESRFHKPPLNITEYFEDFSDNGYVLYSRDHNNGGPGMELGFLKLSMDFKVV